MLLSQDKSRFGNVDVPACRCGKALFLAGIEVSEVTAERRIFQCASCGHELALTVWKAIAS